MPLVGTFSTMSLPDLLQWLASAGKTGTLYVERNRSTRSIRVRSGRVIGSSSDDPELRLGQFLLSRRVVSEEQLSQALVASEESSQFLGQTFVELGMVSTEEMRSQLQAKAEEVIYSLFDWSDSVFRFEETIDDQKDIYPVDLRVDDVLLRGLKRFDEMSLIRKVLHSAGIVLRYTSKPPSPEIFGDATTRAMYAAIDGERTLAEILLHVHGAEYSVKKFYYDLLVRGFVEIAEVRELPTPSEPQAEDGAAEAQAPSIDLHPSEPPATEGTVAGRADQPGRARAGTAAATLPPPRKKRAVLPPPTTVEGLTAALAEASRLMTQGEVEESLDTLQELYKVHPGDDALRRLIAEAEAAFVEKAYRHYLPADRIPILSKPIGELSGETLTPQEFFMLSRIDGSWDVRSIVQVAPLREVDALRTLKRMRELGMIELCDPA